MTTLNDHDHGDDHDDHEDGDDHDGHDHGEEDVKTFRVN